MKPSVVARAEALLDGEAAWWQPVGNRIGASSQERLRIRLADGRTAFAKAATGEESAAWLRAEHRVYAQVEAPFLPRLLAWEEEPLPLLAVEDLGEAGWPPPWTEERVAAVRAALAQLAAVEPPEGLPRLEETPFTGWQTVAESPGPFLALGLCRRAWLEAALPALREAADAAPLAGRSLVHVDVRSDNFCVRDGRALLAGLPAPPWGPRLRALQLGQLRVALPWAAFGLGLPAPA